MYCFEGIKTGNDLGYTEYFKPAKNYLYRAYTVKVKGKIHNVAIPVKSGISIEDWIKRNN